MRIADQVELGVTDPGQAPRSTAPPAPPPIGVQKLLNKCRAAEVCGTTPQNMARWRVQGRGPPYAKIGGRIYYRPEDIEAWIRAQVRQSTSEVRR